MIKKFFHGGQPNHSSSSVSLTEAQCSGPEKDEWNARTGYTQSVARLDQFEARLRETLRILTRHCQAIAEMCTSTSVFSEHFAHLVPDAAVQSSAALSKRQSDEVVGLVNTFRMRAIASLQSLLILVPRLRVRCEHRNGAVHLMLRYQHKVHNLERSTKSKTESSRLLRNRAKLQAATARFRDLDHHVQQEIRIIVSNDIAAIVASPTRELLLRAQLLAGQFAIEGASQLQANFTGPPPPEDSAKDAIRAPEEKQEVQHGLEAEIVLFPLDDNNVDVRQSAFLPPSASATNLSEGRQLRQESATASDIEASISSETSNDDGVEVSGHEIVADVHEDVGIGKRKKHARGTRTWDIHQRIKDNISTGLDLIECVRLPDGFARDEWIAVHVVDFFNEINLLYGTITECCTAETCPRMSAGPCYAYTWTDTTTRDAIHLPASLYVARLMDWIEHHISDPQVFPSNAANYRSDFEQETARAILEQLFRVYAHLYHSHLEHFAELSVDMHLGFCFKRFVFFVKQFNLVEEKELNALRKLIQSVMENSVDAFVSDTPELL